MLISSSKSQRSGVDVGEGLVGVDEGLVGVGEGLVGVDEGLVGVGESLVGVGVSVGSLIGAGTVTVSGSGTGIGAGGVGQLIIIMVTTIRKDTIPPTKNKGRKNPGDGFVIGFGAGGLEGTGIAAESRFWFWRVNSAPNLSPIDWRIR